VKIAAITDDEQTISLHFGRARYYRVYTVEEDEIVNRETRSKAGHHAKMTTSTKARTTRADTALAGAPPAATSG
jgi:predicted Fe-Mo cluster-binding NifX family protein